MTLLNSLRLGCHPGWLLYNNCTNVSQGDSRKPLLRHWGRLQWWRKAVEQGRCHDFKSGGDKFCERSELFPNYAPLYALALKVGGHVPPQLLWERRPCSRIKTGHCRSLWAQSRSVVIQCMLLANKIVYFYLLYLWPVLTALRHHCWRPQWCN